MKRDVKPRTVSLELTTTQDAAIAFTNSRMWVIDGNWQVQDNSLDIGVAPERDTAFTTYAAGTNFGVRYLALQDLLVKPTASGVHGTLVFYGVVVDDLDAYLASVYGGG